MPIAVVATESGRRRSSRTSSGVIAVKPSGNDARDAPDDEGAGEILPVESYRLPVFEGGQHGRGPTVVGEAPHGSDHGQPPARDVDRITDVDAEPLVDRGLTESRRGLTFDDASASRPRSVRRRSR